MEGATYRDIQVNYLRYRPELLAKIESFLFPAETPLKQLASNLPYATAMARMQYLRFPEKLPSSLEEQAQLWKLRYNTLLGKGTPEEYVNNWKRIVKDDVLF